MIKEFVIERKLKKRLHVQQQKIIGAYNGLRKSILVSWIMTAFCPVSFCVYAYMTKDVFVYLNDTYAPIGTKNNLFIITVAGAITVVMIFVLSSLKKIYSNLTCEQTTGRLNESLIYNNGVIVYEYKNFAQISSFGRIVVKIPFSKLIKAIYNEQLKSISFVGDISSLYYDNYKLNMTRGIEEYINETFVIYDYFNPSLLEFLKQQGIKIVYV